MRQTFLRYAQSESPQRIRWKVTLLHSDYVRFVYIVSQRSDGKSSGIDSSIQYSKSYFNYKIYLDKSLKHIAAANYTQVSVLSSNMSFQPIRMGFQVGSSSSQTTTTTSGSDSATQTATSSPGTNTTPNTNTNTSSSNTDTASSSSGK